MTDLAPTIAAPPQDKDTGRYPGLRLFAISFAALFLELMVIRWVPAVVRLVAYYSNLMLISSFLGLGLGAMMARRKWKLLPWFGALLALNIELLMVCRELIAVPPSVSESRFSSEGSVFFNSISLICVFVLNTALFVPLGQGIGRLFQRQSPLRAYAFDLGGSLCGTVAFGFFSLYHFSPVLGMGIVAAVYLALLRGKQRWWNLPPLLLVLATVPLSTAREAIWSPYYYVTIHLWNHLNPPVSEPVANLRTMRDPPTYSVTVNTDFYQMDGTINLLRYTPNTWVYNYVRDTLDAQYGLPYALHPGAGRVCVVGAGGGMDVEAGLMSGASAIDAVEIDPELVKLSHRFNASGVYEDPRVTVHINDARAFFQSSPGGYDLMVFGFLDSQALFSYSANIRLDGFIYTVQSIRKAFSLLKPGGMMSISFAVGSGWMGDKLKGMVREATGQMPVVYASDGQDILCVWRGPPPANVPDRLARFARDTTIPAAVDLPTDDWPYLYLSRRTIPRDYLIIIAALMALSVASVLALRWTERAAPARPGATLAEAHFFFLGAGFLLLETKSIGDCSLYFGTTWFVTMLVICGVLLMVLAANVLAMRLRRATPWLYLPLLATLLALYLIPRDQILGLPLAWRLLWALLVVPLPIFFAGLIFSTTFRDGHDPAILLGANLIGATVGGFFEYAGMALGTRSLALFVIAAYLASAGCLWIWRRIDVRLPQVPSVQ